MFKERKLPLWARLTSAVVIGTLITGCMGKNNGYVPTPEADPTPSSEPYCDTHMYTYQPNLNLDRYDVNNFPIYAENLMGPAGIGEITSLRLVKNPSSDFTTRVKKSIAAENLPINPETAGIYQFGMQGTEGAACAPFTVVVGEPQSDGTQKSYAAFGVEQIDADKNGEPDLQVLVPAFNGDVNMFLEMGEYKYDNGTGDRVLGAIDQLDPQAINPLFVIKGNGDVTFIPPFLDGPSPEPNNPVPVESAANFVEVSYNPNQNLATVTPDSPIVVSPTATTMPTAEATPTAEVKQFSVCGPENYKNCVIPYQDLFNGNYLNWLNTLPMEPFDATKIKQVQCYGSSTQITFMGKLTEASFANPETSMVRRGVTVGTTSVKDGEVGYDFYGTRDYIVLPVYSYSKSKNGGVWTVLLFPTGNMPENQKIEFIKKWNSSNALMVIANTYFSGMNSANSSEDPMVVNTFKLYPDMQTRLDNFGKNCDLGYISEPGIVLESSYSK